MISWIKGQIIQNWQQSSRKGVVINVGGIGYEVQLLSKQINLIDNSKENEFWIHQINREDGISLYGFKDIAQRDLFRIIINVNGIGPQIGMSLLEDLEVGLLVDAIKESNLGLLTKSQGIGNRIAERLVVELKNKIKQFKGIKNKTTITQKKSNHLANYLQEIKSILHSLGYKDDEIKDSIELIKTNEKENSFLLETLSEDAKAEKMDQHLKEILISLSQKST